MAKWAYREKRTVSSGLRSGRGLKLDHRGGVLSRIIVSSGLRSGRGLKHLRYNKLLRYQYVSSGLRSGRGLKPTMPVIRKIDFWCRPGCGPDVD